MPAVPATGVTDGFEKVAFPVSATLKLLHVPSGATAPPVVERVVMQLLCVPDQFWERLVSAIVPVLAGRVAVAVPVPPLATAVGEIITAPEVPPFRTMLPCVVLAVP